MLAGATERKTARGQAVVESLLGQGRPRGRARRSEAFRLIPVIFQFPFFRLVTGCFVRRHSRGSGCRFFGCIAWFCRKMSSKLDSSSWRKVNPHKEYKERSQPRARKRLGILEKHKDYVKRARDYHRKDDTIKILQEKAYTKNPDEFYYRMHSSHIAKDGSHLKLKNVNDLDAATVSSMKEQDRRYVAMKTVADTRKIEKMVSQIHLIGRTSAAPNTHTFFAEDETDFQQFNLAKHLGTAPELVDRTYNRPHSQTLAARQVVAAQDAGAKTLSRNIERSQGKLYQSLQARISRKQKLQTMLDALEKRRLMSAKGPKIIRKQKTEHGLRRVVISRPIRKR